MTLDESKQLIALMMTYYPNFKPENAIRTAKAWHLALEDIPYQQAHNALLTFLRSDTSGFAPTVGQLVSKIPRVEGESDLEAWSSVRKAISRGNYYAEEEFNKLSPLAQKALGSPSQLRIWAADPDYNESVISSQFLRVYRTVKEREREILSMSPSLRAELGVQQAEAVRIEIKAEEPREYEGVPMPEHLKERLAR